MKLKETVRNVIYKISGIEHPGLFLHRLWEKIFLFFARPFLTAPYLFSDLEDCMVRVRISNRCNCKCKFCALRCSSSTPDVDMDSVWINDYCSPLYKKAKLITFTHGEFLMAPHAFELFQNVAEKYPEATIATESNGIGFDSKWQKLAADNLFRTSFSLNAVSEQTFLGGVWEKDASGGQNAYRLSRKNIRDFLQLLAQEKKLCFAPNFVMVISTETMHEAIDFIRMALKMNAGSVQFFFEVSESPTNQQFFLKAGLHEVLIEIEKIRILLKDRFEIKYDLFIPWGEADSARKVAMGIPESEIKKQYADILLAAEGRSVEREYQEREKIRKSRGKKSFTMEEDLSIYLRTINVNGHPVCWSAWKQLDLSPDGSIQFCGWQKQPLLNIKDYIKNGSVDWEKLFNAPSIRSIRKNFLRHDYRNCMECCPVIQNTAKKNSDGKMLQS